MTLYDNEGMCPKCGDKSNPFTAYVPDKGLFVVCKKCHSVFEVFDGKLREVSKKVLPKSLRELLKAAEARAKLSVAG